jgi:hypothetical protein
MRWVRIIEEQLQRLRFEQTEKEQSNTNVAKVRTKPQTACDALKGRAALRTWAMLAHM